MPDIPALGVVTSLADSNLLIAHDGTDARRVSALNAKTYFGGIPAAADAVYYVSGAGNDANSGLTQAAAMRTLATAYAALPANGGTIMVLPGRYNVGSGLVLTRSKPVWLHGLVRSLAYEVSTTTVPIADNTAAVIFSGSGATDLISFTGATQGFGFRASNLVFEMVAASTKHAISAVDVSAGEVDGCLFFADKTTTTTTTAGGYTAGLTGPAAVDAVGVVAYPSVNTTDASWWRIHNNVVSGLSLCVLGNDNTTTYPTAFNCNQQVVRDNFCLGRSRANVSVLPPSEAGTARPCIRLRGAHRCVVEANNIEAYNVGVQFQDSWSCREAGDGGEYVDVMVDLYNCKTMACSPIGISYGPNGSYSPYVTDAMLVRGDAFVKGCVFILPTWTSANTQRVYPPTNDAADPSISLGSPDNIVIASRWSSFLGVTHYSGTGSPNSAIVGSVGDLYVRTDGGADTTLYVKESGTATNTGWVAHGAPGAVADGSITSAKIADGAIVNADVNASAAIALSKLATDPLARANHTGTQLAATVSDFDTAVRTSRLDQMAAPTAAVSLNSQKVTSLLDPTAAQDAATKAYVDGAVIGIDWKPSVRAASTANGTLTTAYANGSVIDGVTLATGNRILLKDQTTGADNGIYTVNASGAPTRAVDADTSAEVTGGLAVWVNEGTANADTGWVVTTNDTITLGTTALVFTQFSGLGQVTAGQALTKIGNTLDVAVDGSTVEINADALRVKASGVTSNELAASAVIAGKIAAGTVVNADVSASAAIALSKLATDPLARANHTGTQLASTVSDFDTQVRTSRVDQLAALTDITTANVSTTAHGLAPKLPNDATKYLDGTGAYTVPAGGGAAAVTVVGRTTDASSITSSTVLVADTTLRVPLAGVSTDVWFAEFFMRLASANTTMDVKFGWTFPTGATMQWAVLSSGSTSFTSFGAQTTATTAGGFSVQTDTLSLGSAAGGNAFPVLLGAWIFDGGTAGNVAINYAQATSDAGSLLIKKGSFVRYSKVA